MKFVAKPISKFYSNSLKRNTLYTSLAAEGSRAATFRFLLADKPLGYAAQTGDRFRLQSQEHPELFLSRLMQDGLDYRGQFGLTSPQQTVFVLEREDYGGSLFMMYGVDDKATMHLSGRVVHLGQPVLWQDWVTETPVQLVVDSSDNLKTYSPEEVTGPVYWKFLPAWRPAVCAPVSDEPSGRRECRLDRAFPDVPLDGAAGLSGAGLPVFRTLMACSSGCSSAALGYRASPGRGCTLTHDDAEQSSLPGRLYMSLDECLAHEYE
eukprot:gnl/Hemi2/22162_TR7387_c0_g1_i1.p1 gnl/Hemi2/22162_TR7387_c0_g1~~gnl/Hemi2/22162_TR7387_c0_g1_i1.p1  ORF type:complete len:280 (+),score=50.81 gnl/Hemi2/22162_TR7387_c0_g1_i1:46-840(+)